MVVHTFNSQRLEGWEACGSLWVRGQPSLHSEFQDSQGYLEKPVTKKQKQKPTPEHNYIEDSEVPGPFKGL